jgi:branched-chain amino acid transport system substrate-binding protein
MKSSYLIILINFFIVCPAFNYFSSASDIYIGVACPLSGDDKLCGDAMLKGINLYVDDINKNGQLFGQQIHLIIKDDKNDKYAALKAAKEFAHDDRILLVIGHYFSATSIVAGRIYRNLGIPVITASATSEKVTDKNEWYFRVIPDNAFQSFYIANYAKSHLKVKRVIIIHDQDEYGTSLASNFEKSAKDLGIDIRKKFVYQHDTNNASNNLEKIINELIKMDDSNALFLAVHASDSVKIVDVIKKTGKEMKILGADSLGTDTFIKQLVYLSRIYPSLTEYTENIHYVTPFMYQITNKQGHNFLIKYQNKYDEHPYWIAACYYDAICAGMNAIKKAHLNNKDNIYSKRSKIKDNLKLFYSYENSIKGVTGNIFFDENGNTEKPMIIGVFQNNQPIPSYAQYGLIPPQELDDQTLEKTLEGDMIVINENVMQKINLVYASIHMIKIENINLKNFSFEAKFNLYFKFMDSFTDHDIIFSNAVRPLSLSAPISTTHKDAITTKKYLVNGRFYSPFDMKNFPSGTQKIAISFYHKTLTRDKLIYVSGANSVDNDFQNISVSGWKCMNQTTYQSFLEKTIKSQIVESAKPNIYSQLNTVIEIKRSHIFYALLHFIPLIVFILIPYFMLIKIDRHLNMCIPLFSLILILISCYHYYESIHLNIQYITMLEYIIFACYFLLLGAISYIVILKRYFEINSRIIARKFHLSGVIIYSILVILIVAIFIIKNWH